MYSFSYDPDRALLAILQTGYWPMELFRGYEEAYLDHHERIRQHRPSYRVLADCRDYPVQSADVGTAFAALFERLMRENRGHCAIVTGSALNSMQAKRAIPFTNVRVFAEPQDAMEWLFAEGSLPG